MSKIIMVTGGQRSGKSEFAEKMVLGLSENPLYVATAEVRDEEFAERVRRHRERRGAAWSLAEEPLRLSAVDVRGRVVLVDCLTLWATNAFFRCGENRDEAFALLKSEFDKLKDEDATLVFVTNEIGLGGVSADAMQRRFADLQGDLNRLVAGEACEVYMVVSGIPVKIK